ncbi:hypothetical protein KKG71_06965 [Patescibacteria group bacterium]|nr:hypothetical protein [Patescibacteria group bacterium]
MRRERSERILWGEEEPRSDLKKSRRDFLRLAQRAPTSERKPAERCERSEQDSTELSSILWGEEEVAKPEEASEG